MDNGVIYLFGLQSNPFNRGGQSFLDALEHTRNRTNENISVVPLEYAPHNSNSTVFLKYC